ncbi:MAG: dTDP-4-dehydrorhamnose reductase [Cyanobacteria bacterium RI_101]|nr:dTDP-4-dehydrorhamnose reductase [Cyanobacteria bacterium RI_101]
MTKLLLLGAQGQVGQELQQTLAPLGEVVALDRAQLDLTQEGDLREFLHSQAPAVVVNAAAYTAVDRAEQEPELAEAVNARVPQILAEESQTLGAYLIHISTDYVFDGQKNSPYLETDPTAPLGVYGESKLAGERAILKTGAEALILRTAWVYGVYGQGNFVKTMLRLGKERRQLKVVVDQVGSPTWAKDIASALARLIPQRATGIYHFTNSGAASWYDFATAIFAEARALGAVLEVKEVLPIPTSAYPTPARRPAYSVLSWEKTAAALGAYPPHWRESLRQMLVEAKAEGLF